MSAEPVAETRTPVLEGRGITKTFPGVNALSDVSLRVFEGEVVGLVGENGAGKSTLLSILSGSLKPDEGQILIAGEQVQLGSAVEANHLGVFRAQQDQGLLPNLTVAENLFLGHETKFTSAGLLRRRKLVSAARDRIATDEQLRGVTPDTLVGELPLDLRQLVEIVRGFALAELLDTGKPVVLLDETTASLNHDEVEDLFKHVRERRDEASFVFVSHRLHEVLDICDRIYVLKDGVVVAELDAKSADEAMLHNLMVGRVREEQYYLENMRKTEFGESSLVLDRLTAEPEFRDITLTVRQGEILALGGVTGSGKSHLARAIAGDYKVTDGTVAVDGRPLPASGTNTRLGRVAYGPLDRHAEGVSLLQSIRLNVTLSCLDRFLSPMRTLLRGPEVKHVKQAIDEYSIVTPDEETLVDQLSGGNQQKVMLARLVSSDAKVLVLDNPTRGVDAGARHDIYLHLRRLADKGMAILMISDDLHELIGMGDRVAVLKDGVLAHVWDEKQTRTLTEEDVVVKMV
jgi:ribose transport system ATP-binding protein